MRVLVAGAELAGHLTGFQIGFAYSSLVDPQSGARNGVLSALYANLVVMVFLVIDGHHQLLQALAASYSALPIGGSAWAATGELAPLVARTLGTVFVIGVRIAAPVVLVLFVVEVALGLLSRVAPQLNLIGERRAAAAVHRPRRARRHPRRRPRRGPHVAGAGLPAGRARRGGAPLRTTMSQERTEQPTGKRLRDAAERGQVARSKEVQDVVQLAAALMTLIVGRQLHGQDARRQGRRRPVADRWRRAPDGDAVGADGDRQRLSGDACRSSSAR